MDDAEAKPATGRKRAKGEKIALVMQTSRYPSTAAQLVARGRVALTSAEHAGRLVELGHARTATKDEAAKHAAAAPTLSEP